MNRAFGDPCSKERPELVASAQHGLLSRAQAHAIGLSKDSIYRRVQSGKWELVLPGVYRIAGSPPGWHQDLMAACLWAGRGAAASHRAAAALWKLDGFAPGITELSTTRNLTCRAPGILMHRVNRLTPAETTVVSSIPVTTPTRTLFDLAGIVEQQLVEAALDDSLRRRLASLPRLRWAAREFGGHGRGGVSAMKQLLKERGPESPPGSRLETRLIRLLRDSRLPKPRRQYEIREGGKLIARVDLAYPEARLAIEADGYRYHSARSAWQHDRVRRNALTSRDWQVLHITWEDLQLRPKEILGEIARTLSHRSPEARSLTQRTD
jgi:very-short-patch-repair endonuclease